MLAYSIIRAGGRKRIPLVIFEDSRYEIVSAFLLAEARSFGSQIEKGLTSVMNGMTREYCFSGNVYTLTADPVNASIVDDVSENDLHISLPTEDLAELVSAYRKSCRG